MFDFLNGTSKTSAISIINELYNFLLYKGDDEKYIIRQGQLDPNEEELFERFLFNFNAAHKKEALNELNNIFDKITGFDSQAGSTNEEETFVTILTEVDIEEIEKPKKKERPLFEYRFVVFKDLSNDYSFITKSCVQTKDTIIWEDGQEYPLYKLEISHTSHPAFKKDQKAEPDAFGVIMPQLTRRKSTT